MNSRSVKALELIAAIFILAICVTGLYGSFLHGVRHDSNYGMVLSLIVIAGGAISTAVGLMMTIIVAIRFKSISRPVASIGFLVGISGIIIPWATWQIMPAVSTYSERQDFESAGSHILRDAADLLVQRSNLREYPFRWFGGEVPPAEIPEPIRNFIPQATYVTANDQGVVIVTDGMGSWRGGYMILPTKSSFIPEKSRYISAGFYYVTAQ